MFSDANLDSVSIYITKKLVAVFNDVSCPQPIPAITCLLVHCEVRQSFFNILSMGTLEWSLKLTLLGLFRKIKSVL